MVNSLWMGESLNQLASQISKLQSTMSSLRWQIWTALDTMEWAIVTIEQIQWAMINRVSSHKMVYFVSTARWSQWGGVQNELYAALVEICKQSMYELHDLLVEYKKDPLPALLYQISDQIAEVKKQIENMTTTWKMYEEGLIFENDGIPAQQILDENNDEDGW